jgi:hypothetical protein
VQPNRSRGASEHRRGHRRSGVLLLERNQATARERYKPPADPVTIAKAQELRSKAAGYRADAATFASPDDQRGFLGLAYQAEAEAAELETQVRGGVRR